MKFQLLSYDSIYFEYTYEMRYSEVHLTSETIQLTDSVFTYNF